MKILAIETSCDETAVAILETEKDKLKILANIISSQVKLHAKYGGVYPSLARREHQRNLPVVIKKALKEAKSPKLDLIAVTVGPGLDPCLWVGVNFAKELAQKLNRPIVPVNHVEAHLLANLIEGRPMSLKFPAIGLVVSGGHTQMVLMKRIGRYEILGETRDDAAGECFDKVARILGLGYPGGPIVDKLAGRAKFKDLRLKIKLPRPMIGQKNYDFSFSGLKTAVLYQYQKSKIKNQNYKRAMCKEVQQSIIDVLIRKTIKAAKNFRAKSIILGGGVIASDELKEQFQSAINSQRLAINFLVPPKKFCTDNAVMIAATAYFNKNKKKNWSEIKADANMVIGK